MQAWAKLYNISFKTKQQRRHQNLNPPKYCLVFNTISMSVQPCAELLQHKATEILLKKNKI